MSPIHWDRWALEGPKDFQDLAKLLSMIYQAPSTPYPHPRYNPLIRIYPEPQDLRISTYVIIFSNNISKTS